MRTAGSLRRTGTWGNEKWRGATRLRAWGRDCRTQVQHDPARCNAALRLPLPPPCSATTLGRGADRAYEAVLQASQFSPFFCLKRFPELPRLNTEGPRLVRPELGSVRVSTRHPRRRSGADRSRCCYAGMAAGEI